MALVKPTELLSIEVSRCNLCLRSLANSNVDAHVGLHGVICYKIIIIFGVAP